MKESLQNSLNWAVLLSETSHVFCCVLPTVFSLMGLLAGLGVVATLPPSMIALHDILHHWELPMIIASGAVLALGWGATWYSDRIDCHSTGCCHDACAPRKNKAHVILKIATVLFVVNVAVYALIHRSGWIAPAPEAPIGHLHEENMAP